MNTYLREMFLYRPHMSIIHISSVQTIKCDPVIKLTDTIAYALSLDLVSSHKFAPTSFTQWRIYERIILLTKFRGRYLTWRLSHVVLSRAQIGTHPTTRIAAPTMNPKPQFRSPNSNLP